MTGHLPSEPIMRAKNLCLLLVISFPYFITRLLTPRCASRGKSRLELAEEIGADGRYLLEKVYTSTDYRWLQELPAIERVRCIWIQQYHASEQGAVWRKDQELPPSALLIQSPYDIEARYSKKKTTAWVGYVRRVGADEIPA